MRRELELTEPVDLCDAKGRLARGAVGWSRQPLHRANLRGRWLRKKRWNYWAITTDTHLFSVTLSNLDYAGVAFVYFLDFGTKWFHEQTVLAPLGRGIKLPDTVTGEASFLSPSLAITMADDGSAVTLHVASKQFGGRPLTAAFHVTRPASHESVNVVIPWNERTFQFTSKQQALPATGHVQLGDERTDFTGFACLDLGRGIWPFRGFWNWAAASGVQGKHTVGLNLGGGWTDGTGMTETGFVVDGKVTKVADDLQFVYDDSDFMRPWRIRTATTDQIDLEFVPFFERVAATNALIIRSEVHQLIGHFRGRITTDAGQTLELDNLVGWAEEHRARW